MLVDASEQPSLGVVSALPVPDGPEHATKSVHHVPVETLQQPSLGPTSALLVPAAASMSTALLGQLR